MTEEEEKNFIPSSTLGIVSATYLFKDVLEFLNKVPNNKYGDSYKLCSRIEEFLEVYNRFNKK